MKSNKLNKSNMYLPITKWLDQNPILFPCGRNRRSNHVTHLSLLRHTLKLILLFIVILLLTLILVFIGLLPDFLCLLTMSVLFFIVRSLKCDRAISQYGWRHLNMISHLLLLEELP
jgi:hypothetical protein